MKNQKESEKAIMTLTCREQENLKKKKNIFKHHILTKKYETAYKPDAVP
jgi:hypothetical protein